MGKNRTKRNILIIIHSRGKNRNRDISISGWCETCFISSRDEFLKAFDDAGKIVEERSSRDSRVDRKLFPAFPGRATHVQKADPIEMLLQHKPRHSLQLLQR